MKNLRAIFTGAERSILPDERIVYLFKIQCNFFWLFAVLYGQLKEKHQYAQKNRVHGVAPPGLAVAAGSTSRG